MFKKRQKILLIAIFFFLLTGLAFCAAKYKRTSTMKEVQGQIAWLKKDRISILFYSDEVGRTESEILLPFDKGLKIVHKNSLSDLSLGDTVSVQYEEVTEETPEGTKSSRRAKAIIFVSPAVKKIKSEGILKTP